MMKNHFKKIVLLLVSSFLFLACQGYGQAASGNVNGVEVNLSVKPSKPVSGENHFKVSLKSQAEPVANANVTLRYFMPAMGSMPAMQGSNVATPSATSGEYETDLNLPMEGDWTITVLVQTDGKPPLNASFHLRTGSESINFEGE